MRRKNRLYGYFLLSVFALGGILGCAQKEKVSEAPSTTSDETSMTVVELGSPSKDATTPAVPITQNTTPIATTPASATMSAATPLPQDALQRTRTVQLALKEAGFYSGNVDGKTGPLTQKAIEDFQKAKGLKVDGKVGPMTWTELAKYVPQETKTQ